MRGFIAVTCLTVLTSTGTAWGWGPLEHNSSGKNVFNNTWVRPSVLAAGLVPDDVAGQCADADLSGNQRWEDDQWPEISARGYVYNSKWGEISEDRRLAYLVHVTMDDGVPTGHTPGVAYWNEYQNSIELRADTTMPTPAISSYFTGTIANQRAQFYDAAIANSIWGSQHVTSQWEASVGDTGATVITNGLFNGERLSVAVVLDYFRAKMPTVAEANGDYYISPGESVRFRSANSYDPDEVSTNADGSATQLWTGLTRDWDLNGDGTFETAGDSPTVSYSQLATLGVGPGEHTVCLRCRDNEGSTYLDQYNNGGVSYDFATLTVVPEASSFAMFLAMASCLGIWLRPDGRRVCT